MWLKTLTKINPTWLTTLGRALCTFSKPVPVEGGVEGGQGERAGGQGGPGGDEESRGDPDLRGG